MTDFEFLDELYARAHSCGVRLFLTTDEHCRLHRLGGRAVPEGYPSLQPLAFWPTEIRAAVMSAWRTHAKRVAEVLEDS
jgi:hypothetical protein